jgi:hypothetical protein
MPCETFGCRLRTFAGKHQSAGSPKIAEAWSPQGWTVCDMMFRCPCAPPPPPPRVRARARVCAHALGLERAHELTRVRARVPVCAADAKVQCEAQMKYRIMRKEMLQPHQAILPRMPVMPTVRGTTNMPVDEL